MSVFDIFKSEKKAKVSTVKPPTDEDRELSLRIRRENAEYNRQMKLMDMEIRRLDLELRRAEIQAQIDEIVGVDDGDGFEEQALSQILSPLISKMTPGNPTQQGIILDKEESPPNRQNFINSFSDQGTTYTDEQLLNMWNNLPPFYKTQAKKFSDQDLAGIIQQQIPGINQDSTIRAIKIVRSAP